MADENKLENIILDGLVNEIVKSIKTNVENINSEDKQQIALLIGFHAEEATLSILESLEEHLEDKKQITLEKLKELKEGSNALWNLVGLKILNDET